MEVAVLKRLQDSGAHICEFIGCGRNSKVNYLVMTILGPNLSELRRHQPHQKFSISTTLRVGVQIILAIQSMHDCGFLHRDIKPSNFAIGDTPETSRTCHMLDYGLARQYTTVTGEVRQPRSIAGFRGTVRYASVNAHLSRDLGRHDDLWSVFYLLIELALGHLPWRRIKDKEEAGEFKSQYDHKKLIKGLPVELNDFLEHLRCSSYFDKPDYPRITGALQAAMDRLGVQESDLYDWEQDFSAPSVTTASMVSPPAVKLVHEEKGADVLSPMRTHPEPSRTNCSGVVDLSDGHSEHRDEDKELLKVPRPFVKSPPSDSNQSLDYQEPKPSNEMSSNQYQDVVSLLKENLNIVNKYISDEEENDHYRDAVSSEQQCPSPHLEVSHKETTVSFEQRSSPQVQTGGGGMKSYRTESLNRFYDMESNVARGSYKSLSKESSDEEESHNVSSKYFSKRYDSIGGSNKSDMLNNAVIYPENPNVADVASGFNSLDVNDFPETENRDIVVPAQKLDEWNPPEDPLVKSGSEGRIKHSIDSPHSDALASEAESPIQTHESKHQSNKEMSSPEDPKGMAVKSRSKERIKALATEEDSGETEDNSSHQSIDEPLRKLIVCQLLVNSNTESSRSIEMLFAQKTQNTDFTNHPASDENKDAGSGSQNFISGNFIDDPQPDNSSAVQLIPADDMVTKKSAETLPADDQKPNIHVSLSEYTGRNSLAKIMPQVMDEHSSGTYSSGEPARQTKSASNFLEVSPKTMRIHPRPPPNPPPTKQIGRAHV